MNKNKELIRKQKCIFFGDDGHCFLRTFRRPTESLATLAVDMAVSPKPPAQTPGHQQHARENNKN